MNKTANTVATAAGIALVTIASVRVAQATARITFKKMETRRAAKQNDNSAEVHVITTLP